MNYQPMERQRETFNAYCWVKETGLKRLYGVWYQLCDIMKKVKYRQIKCPVIAGYLVELGGDEGEVQEFDG